MAKIIQVTPELLESTAGKIEGLAGDYKTQYDQLSAKQTLWLRPGTERTMWHLLIRLQVSKMILKKCIL